MIKVSDHFRLEEFIPRYLRPEDIKEPVIGNITRLATCILEPLRIAIGHPVVITSGYRPPPVNAWAGGAPNSDHLTGNAADFYVAGSSTHGWEHNTWLAYEWIRDNLSGQFGQLIWEDHRVVTRSSRRLWIHVSNVTDRHPGRDDANRLLVSLAPRRYEAYRDDLEPLA